MKQVNVHEAKTRLSALLGDVEKGKSFLICRNGVPVADLIPHCQRSRIQAHPVLGAVEIDYDPTEPLGENEWGEVS